MEKLKNIFFRGFLYSFKIGFLPFLPQFSTLIFKKNPIIRNLSTVYIREQFYTNSRVSSVCLLLILSIIPSKSFQSSLIRTHTNHRNIQFLSPLTEVVQSYQMVKNSSEIFVTSKRQTLNKNIFQKIVYDHVKIGPFLIFFAENKICYKNETYLTIGTLNGIHMAISLAACSKKFCVF